MRRGQGTSERARSMLTLVSGVLTLPLLVYSTAQAKGPGLLSYQTKQASDAVSDPIAPGGGDGVYGRLRGDFSYRLSLGAEADVQQSSVRPLLMAEVVGYQTLGVYAAYREGLIETDPLQRTLSVGLTFSPLFLWRWSKARESGHAYWDLFVDSLGIGGGVHLTQPKNAPFAQNIGAELAALAGVPLLPRANGPWLRVRGILQTGRPSVDGFSDLGGAVWLYLSWEGFFYTGLLRSRER